MKKFLLAAVAMTALVAQISVAAQLKVGVMDTRSVMQRSPEMNRIKVRLQKQFKAQQTKIITANKALQEDINKLKRDEAILTTAQKVQVQERIIRNKRDLERLQEDFKQDVSRAQQVEMKKYFEQLNKAVKSFAKAEGYDLILDKTAVPFSNDSVDVTSKLLAQLK